MRSRLLHPLRDRPHERGERRSYERRITQPRTEPRVIVMDEPHESAHDPAAERVRSAGGPLDLAVYTCGCGYLFSAAVSTTVSCPHCGAGQAW